MALTDKERAGIIQLFTTCIAMIIIAGFIAFKTSQYNDPSLSFSRFINGQDTLEFQGVLVGAMSGFVFGVIDNGGLFFGMSKLDPILPSGRLLSAGLGNTFSDALGGFLGTFAGIIVKNLSGYDRDYPIWAETVGLIIGCLVGVYVPAAITGQR